MVDLPMIQTARERLRAYLTPTPFELAPRLGEQNIYLKLESAGKTHSFKVRGALNAILSLSPEELSRGVVAASTGNHAQGLAYAGWKLGVKTTIVMPEYAVRRKISGVRRWGAEVIVEGESYADAENAAHQLCKEQEMVYISAYNNPHVIAGGGTVGLEILDELPDVERVIVPVGGGGLICGIAVAMKSLKPDCEIIGVNAAESPDMYNIFYDMQLPLNSDTLADALEGAIEQDSITINLATQYVDQIVLASETDIERAMRYLVYEAGWVGEGGGAVGIAALMSGAVHDDKKTAIVVTGGNVDGDTLMTVLGEP